MVKTFEELAPGDFARVLPLFTDFGHALAVRPAVEGKCHGRMFVDDLDEPSVGLVWEGRTFYVAGPPPAPSAGGSAAAEGLVASLTRLSGTTLLPELGPGGCRFAYWPETWEPALEQVLAPFPHKRVMRHFYTLRPPEYHPRHDWRAAVPEGCSVRQVTPELLADPSVEMSSLRHELVIMWADLERFFENAFGFCLMGDGKVLGWCLTEYPNGDRRGIGIETAEDQCRKGYGWITASACVEHAFGRRLTVHWDSWANNAASVGLAKKLGFTLTREYPVLGFWKA